MECHHAKTQIQQLLKCGYKAEDIKPMVNAQQSVIDQAIIEFQLEQQSYLKAQRSQQSQASYAMRLGR